LVWLNGRWIAGRPRQAANAAPGQRENTAIGSALLGTAQSAPRMQQDCKEFGKGRGKYRPALVGAGYR